MDHDNDKIQHTSAHLFIYMHLHSNPKSIIREFDYLETDNKGMFVCLGNFILVEVMNEI